MVDGGRRGWRRCLKRERRRFSECQRRANPSTAFGDEGRPESYLVFRIYQANRSPERVDLEAKRQSEE